MAIKELAYNSLERISQIKEVEERTTAIRTLCQERPAMAVFIQYTYHPDVKMDLPEGEVPQSLWKRAEHDQYGMFYGNVKRLRNFSPNAAGNRLAKERAFFALLESVSAKDAELFIACKNKKLPWKGLSASFCKKALPELFPADMKVNEKEDA